MKFRSLAAALALATLSLAGLARATSVIPPTFPELVAEAESIVQGTVTAVESRLTTAPNGRPVIMTFVTVTVADSVKGTATAGSSLTLQFLGGTVGKQTLAVTGMPTFKVGDREFLFVQGNGKNYCPLVALYHGRYRVLTDAATQRDYIARDNGVPLTALAEVGFPLTDRSLLAATHTPAAALSLASFASQVRTQALPTHVTP